ncbi:hypothetical protein Ancab_010900 [Ancistrocladus abbreviatus]
MLHSCSCCDSLARTGGLQTIYLEENWFLTHLIPADVPVLSFCAPAAAAVFALSSPAEVVAFTTAVFLLALAEMVAFSLIAENPGPDSETKYRTYGTEWDMESEAGSLHHLEKFLDDEIVVSWMEIPSKYARKRNFKAMVASKSDRMNYRIVFNSTEF